MNSFAKSAIVALLAMAAAPGMPAESAGPTGTAAASPLVRVLATYQEQDPRLPWRRSAPGSRAGYGVAVGPGMILTTEKLVRNQTMVEIMKGGSGRKIVAEVKVADWQVDLAVLAVDPAETPSDAILKLAEKVPPRSKLSLLQFDESSQPQTTDAEIVHVAMDQLPDSPSSSLIFDVLTSVNVNGEGAAFLLDGKLAGLLISYREDSRTGAILPYPVLRRFLDDAGAPPYRGVASAGFFWAPLVDPAKRRYLGVPDNDEGILVLACLPDSGASKALREGDVILEWDGRRIDNLGLYDDENFGRLSFPHLIHSLRRPGETISALVIRAKEETVVNVQLTRMDDSFALIPEEADGQQPEYLVAGGFVMRELTGRYLRAHGPNWDRAVNSRLVNLYLTRRYKRTSPGERVVIVTGVLPDAINVGYDDFRNQVVEKINGCPVKNMQDVFLVVDRDAGLKTLGLKGFDTDVVLDPAELAAANARLQAAFHIPALRYQRRPEDPIKEKQDAQ